MGKREVTIYTCDGCKVSSTINRDEAPRGFTRIRIGSGDVWLCSVCYGAVEWVSRFQGVTAPPRVYGTGIRATLRKPARES